MSRRGWILFLAMSAIWGLPYFMIRVAVRQLDPGTLVFARTAVATVILVPLAARQRSFGPLKKVWAWLLAYTVIEIAVPWLFLASSEEHLTSSFAGLLVASVPLVAIILTKFLHRDEVITRARLFGLAVGFIGVLTLVGLDVHRGSVFWIALMVVVIVCYALGPMILSLKLQELPALGVVAASVGIVALGYLPWGVTHWPTHLRTETVTSIIGLAVICTAGAFVVFLALIKEVGPSRSVVITYFNTAVAVVIGTVGLHEPLTIGIAIGFPLIIFGSYFATSHSAKLAPEQLDRRDEPRATR